MDFEKFKNVLLKRPEDISEKLFTYGYECGRMSYINFEIIRQAFYNYNYTQKEQKYYIHRIIMGYKKGEV